MSARRGFVSIIIVAVIALIIGVVAAVAYIKFFYLNTPLMKAETKMQDGTLTLPPDEMAGWKTYRNEEAKFQIKYPPNFKFQSSKAFAGPDGVFLPPRDFLIESSDYKRVGEGECPQFTQGGTIGVQFFDYNKNTDDPLKFERETIAAYKGVEEQTQVGGQVATKFTYSVPSYVVLCGLFPEETLEKFYVMNSSVGKTYRIDVRHYNKDNQLYMGLKQILSTFRFTN